jgi:hypothetical protein
MIRHPILEMGPTRRGNEILEMGPTRRGNEIPAFKSPASPDMKKKCKCTPGGKNEIPHLKTKYLSSDQNNRVETRITEG